MGADNNDDPFGLGDLFKAVTAAKGAANRAMTKIKQSINDGDGPLTKEEYKEAIAHARKIAQLREQGRHLEADEIQRRFEEKHLNPNTEASPTNTEANGN